MKNIDVKALGKFLTFLYRCNNETNAGNDFSIVDIVFANIGKDTFPSIDELSEQSHISKASISRFVKKYNFTNYAEFRNIMGAGAKSFGYNLTLRSYHNIYNKDDQDIIEETASSAIANILATKENIQMDMLHQIVDQLLNSKEVVFIGGDRDLECFIKIQIVLTTYGIPAYFFLNHEVKITKSYTFTKDTTVMLINVASEFFNYKKVLDEANKRGAHIICFNQDDEFKYKDQCDLYYQYGINKSLNQGYYSLLFIADLLERLLQKKLS